MEFQNVERKNKKGVLIRPLYVPQLEYEFWQDLNTLKHDHNLTTLTAAVKLAIKKAVGKA